NSISRFTRMPFLRCCAVSLAVGLATVMSSLRSDASEPLGAKVACFGDSITKQGYPETLVRMHEAEAINADVGGNTSSHALRRMFQVVLSKHHDPRGV